jgi:hypothetical protein
MAPMTMPAMAPPEREWEGWGMGVGGLVVGGGDVWVEVVCVEVWVLVCVEACVCAIKACGSKLKLLADGCAELRDEYASSSALLLMLSRTSGPKL